MSHLQPLLLRGENADVEEGDPRAAGIAAAGIEHAGSASTSAAREAAESPSSYGATSATPMCVRRLRRRAGTGGGPTCRDKCVLTVSSSSSDDGGGSHNGHSQAERASARRRLSIAIGLSFFFMVLEIIGGFLSNSLAIMTDAAHLLSDVASFAISLFALWMAEWEATPKHSFGYHRMEILGALVSMQLIWMITGVLLYEAIVRLLTAGVEVDGRLMFITATFGVAVNIIQSMVLGHHHHHGHGHDDHDHGPRSGQHHGHGHHGHGDGHGQGHNHGHDHNESLAHDHDHAHDDDVYDHDHGHDHSHDHDHDHGHDNNHDHGHDRDHDHTGSSGVTVNPNCKARKHRTSLSDGKSTGVVAAAAAAASSPIESTNTAPLKPTPSMENCICVVVPVEEDTHRRGGHEHAQNVNLRGAYLHVLGDLMQSVGVMVGGAVIWYKPEWKIVDLFCTLFFSVLVLCTTLSMLRDVMDVLMESTPRHIDAKAVEAGLRRIPGVLDVHELHIWAITMGKVVLAAHVVIDCCNRPDCGSPEGVLEDVLGFCEQRYGISHATIQVERRGVPDEHAKGKTLLVTQ